MRLLAGLSLGFGAICFAGSAIAGPLLSDMETTATMPDGKTYKVWVGPSLFSAPVANGLGSVGDRIDFLFQQQTDPGASLGFGASVGANAWFDALGRSFFVQLDTDFAGSSTASTTTVTFSPDNFLDILPINGDPSPGEIVDLPTGAEALSTATVSYSRVTSEFGMGVVNDPSTKVAVGLLASAGGLHLSSAVTENPAVPGVDNSLSETVTMGSLGPVVSGQFERPIQGNASLVLDGRAALLVAHGTLTAHQSTSGSNPGVWDVTNSTNTFGGLLEANAGVKFALNNGMNLVVSGGAGVRNDYFSIVNPRSAPGLDADVGSPGTELEFAL